MSNTFTAQGLADFYQKVADGGEAQLKIDEEWANLFVGGPSLGSSKDVWRIKPAKKVIYLSVLIDSQIDCEFNDDNEAGLFISKLSRQGDPSMNYRYYDGDGDTWESCRPRMNHKHAWLHNNCPIEGFVVRAWTNKEDSLTVKTSSNTIDWSKIMYVEFLGVEHAYVMPWEQDDD